MRMDGLDIGPKVHQPGFSTLKPRWNSPAMIEVKVFRIWLTACKRDQKSIKESNVSDGKVLWALPLLPLFRFDLKERNKS